MSFINYAGGRVLDGMQQQLEEVKNAISLLVDKNLANDMVAKTTDQVSSNQTEVRRLLETKIENQTLELNQVISAGNTLQTDLTCTKLYTLFRTEVKNHTLTSGTSLYRPYKGVPPRIFYELGDI